MLRDGGLADFVGMEVAPTYLARHRPHGAGDLLSAAVADGEDHCHAGVVASGLDVSSQRLVDRAWQAFQVADRQEADLVPHHLAELRREVSPEQAHQTVDLFARPVQFSVENAYSDK